MIRRLAVTAVLLGSVLTAVGTADAARGGKKGGANRESSGSSIVLDQAAPIVHGQAVTFTVSTSATDRPYSYVTCYQGGTLVYHSSKGHFADAIEYFGEPIHYLSSMAWPSGDADCTAELIYKARNGRTRTAASTSFHVDG